jgi:hypothetical protein
MKEIDFLPDWYKSGRRREAGYRVQYLVLVGLAAVMAAWNFGAVHSISRAGAELDLQSKRKAEMGSAAVEYARVKSELAAMEKKAKRIDSLCSRIDVSSVIGELSYLIDEHIVLRELSFTAEKFEDKAPKGQAAAAVRVAAGGAEKGSAGTGAVRFKVMIKGVAPAASDVAGLVVKLEDSAYFHEITSSWRNQEIKAGSPGGNKTFQASDFDIGCYIANYRVKNSGVAQATGGSVVQR